MASGDVESLTNEEIREQLLSRGQVVGPVIETTRELYLNKLKRLMNSAESSDTTEAQSLTSDSKKNASNDASSRKSMSAVELNSDKENHTSEVNVSILKSEGLRKQPAPEKPSLATKSAESDEQVNGSGRGGDDTDGENGNDGNGDDDDYYGEETSRFLTAPDAKNMQTECNETSMLGPIARHRYEIFWVLRCFSLLVGLFAIMYFCSTKYPERQLGPEEEL